MPESEQFKIHMEIRAVSHTMIAIGGSIDYQKMFAIDC